MESITKPMLAGSFKNYKEEVKNLPWPNVYATNKMDGIRCLIIRGKAVSRTFKDIPNRHICKMLSGLPDNLDGELLTTDFNKTTSAVMSEDGEPDFHYYIFDYVKDSKAKPYLERIEDLKKLKLPSFCIKVIPVQIHNPEELDEYEAKSIEDGFEGACIRRGDSVYKEGRGTLKACDLVKVKRFQDAEAEVVDFIEAMQNQNAKELDNFGRTKRSSAQDGLVGKDTLGAVTVKCLNGEFKGVTFNIGTGFNDVDRKEIWNNKKKYLGKVLTFRYQPIGSLNAPRIPSYKGWRSEKDMD